MVRLPEASPVSLVIWLIWFVLFIRLVPFNQKPDGPDRLNRPHEQDRLPDFSVSC